MLIVTRNAMKINEEMFGKNSGIIPCTCITQARELTWMNFHDHNVVSIISLSMLIYGRILGAKYNTNNVISFVLLQSRKICELYFLLIRLKTGDYYW